MDNSFPHYYNSIGILIFKDFIFTSNREQININEVMKFLSNFSFIFYYDCEHTDISLDSRFHIISQNPFLNCSHCNHRIIGKSDDIVCDFCGNITTSNQNAVENVLNWGKYSWEKNRMNIGQKSWIFKLLHKLVDTFSNQHQTF